MSDNPRLDIALSYARKGWRIFPCHWATGGKCSCGSPDCGRSIGKHCIYRHAPHSHLDATSDEAKITQWWTASPKANIGLRMGEGLAAIDFDFYNGGDVALDLLEEKYGKLPYSLRSRSGSGDGSFHLFLSYPKEYEIRSGGSKLGGGIDVKADGGYVILPPSSHKSGGSYLWEDEDESSVEPMPIWMLDLLKKKPQERTDSDPISFDGFLNEENSRYVADYLFPDYTNEEAATAGRHESWKQFAIQCKANRVDFNVHASYMDPYLNWASSTGKQRALDTKELFRCSLKWAYTPGRLDGMKPLPGIEDLFLQQEAEETGVASPVPMLDGARLWNTPTSSAIEEKKTTLQAWVTLSDAIRRQSGTSIRFPTGLAFFDKLTRGGVPMGRMVVLVGAPHSGKTGLAIQVALNMYRTSPDMHVGFYMADEGLEPAAVRMAQREGFAREDLEAAKPEVIEEVAARFADMDRIHCYDPDSPKATLEAFIAGMVARADGKPQLWVIDSAQVVPTDKGRGGDRRVMTATVAELVKSESRKYRATVILLSQSNRKAYSSKREADNSDPLSAAAESGALEHMADVILFLSKDGGMGRAKVQVPKNRLGEVHEAAFHLEWDYQRAFFRERDDFAVSQEEAAEEEEKSKAREWAVAKKVLSALKKNPGGLTTRLVAAKSGLRGRALDASLASLEEKGEIVSAPNTGRGGGVLWSLTSHGGAEIEG